VLTCISQTQLEEDFPEIPKPHVTAVFDANNKLYVPTFLHLEREKALGNLAYVPNIAQVSKAAGKRKKGKGRAPSNHTDFMLERAWLLEKRREHVEMKDAELAQDLEEEGSGVECGCCFTTYSFVRFDVSVHGILTHV
jgi:TRIAD3 protein (E3 ubiquitin-protein ligase RNF216)